MEDNDSKGNTDNIRIGMFRKLLGKDPDNAMVLCSLGIELFKEGEYSEARDLLARAVENKPDYSVAYRTLGRSHFELGEYDEARKVFDRGRRVAVDNGDFQTVKEIDVFAKRLDRQAGE